MSRINPLLLLLGLAFLVPLLLPAVLRLDEAFLGVEEVDTYGTLWFYWFVERAVVEGKSLLHTDLFFHPFGKDILLDTGANLLDAVLALPFRVVFGPVLGMNLFLLAGLTFSALTFRKLALEFVDDRLAAGLGGVLFATHTFVLYEVSAGRPTQGLLGFLPLFLLAAWRMVERGGWRPTVAAAVLLAIIGYQYWYYAIFSAMVAGALVMARLPAAWSQGGWRQAAGVVGRLSCVGVLAALLVLPVVVPVMTAVGEGKVTGLVDASSWTLSSLPLETPEGVSVAITSWQPLRRVVGTWHEHGVGNLFFGELTPMTAWVSLVSVLLFLVRPRRMPRTAFVAMGAVVALIAIGPLVMVGQHYLPNPVYIYAVKAVGVLQRLWWPVRAYSWLAVLGCLATVEVLAWIRTWKLSAGPVRLGGAWLQGAAAAGLLAAWGAHLHGAGLMPLPSWEPMIPAGYRCLADGPPGALLELPHGFTQAHLFYQTAHGRPMLGGMAERSPMLEPEAMQELRMQNTFLHSLLRAVDLDQPLDAWEQADMEALVDLGYGYVVLQKDAFSYTTASGTRDMGQVTLSTRLRRLRRLLGMTLGAPVYEDARIVIYSPWGLAPPCDVASWDLDVEPRPKVRTLAEIRG